MTAFAKNVTPGQTRHFRVEIEGINPFQVQQADMPDVEHDSVDVSDGQSMQKYPGLTKVGDLTIKRLISAFDADDEIFSWLFANGDPEQGVASAPYDIRNGEIFRVDAAGNVVQQWRLTGAWVKKVSGYKFDREKSEKIVDEIVISVNTCQPV